MLLPPEMGVWHARNPASLAPFAGNEPSLAEEDAFSCVSGGRGLRRGCPRRNAACMEQKRIRKEGEIMLGRRFAALLVVGCLFASAARGQHREAEEVQEIRPPRVKPSASEK